MKNVLDIGVSIVMNILLWTLFFLWMCFEVLVGGFMQIWKRIKSNFLELLKDHDSGWVWMKILPLVLFCGVLAALDYHTVKGYWININGVYLLPIETFSIVLGTFLSAWILAQVLYIILQFLGIIRFKRQ